MNKPVKKYPFRKMYDYRDVIDYLKEKIKDQHIIVDLDKVWSQWVEGSHDDVHLFALNFDMIKDRYTNKYHPCTDPTFAIFYGLLKKYGFVHDKKELFWAYHRW